MRRGSANTCASGALVLALAAVWSAAAICDASNPKVEVKRGVVYGTGGGKDLKLNLFIPKGDGKSLRPAMVFIHGGSWRIGNRNAFQRQCQGLAEKGIVCASIDYRLSGEATWPAQIEDCKCAIRWMRAHAAELKIDKDRIGCAGGSAGGHLAAMLATTAGVDEFEGAGGNPSESSAVQLGVIFNGPTDLRQMPGEWRGNPVAQLLGATRSEKPELYEEASPIVHVSKKTAPCLILHGTMDKCVPYAQAMAMKRALDEAGVKAKLVGYEGAGHGFYNRDPEFEQTCTEMEKFISDVFNLPTD